MKFDGDKIVCRQDISFVCFKNKYIKYNILIKRAELGQKRRYISCGSHVNHFIIERYSPHGVLLARLRCDGYDEDERRDLGEAQLEYLHRFTLRVQLKNPGDIVNYVSKTA